MRFVLLFISFYVFCLTKKQKEQQKQRKQKNKLYFSVSFSLSYFYSYYSFILRGDNAGRIKKKKNTTDEYIQTAWKKNQKEKHKI